MIAAILMVFLSFLAQTLFSGGDYALAIAPVALGALIGGGAGLLKGLTFDRAREKRQRRLAATRAALAPLIGQRDLSVQEADPLGSALRLGATGAGLGNLAGPEKIEVGAPGSFGPDAEAALGFPEGSTNGGERLGPGFGGGFGVPSFDPNTSGLNRGTVDQMNQASRGPYSGARSLLQREQNRFV